MLNFIHAFENAAFAIGMTAVNAQSRPQQRVRVVRQTSRASIDRLIAAVRTARAEREAALDECERLNRENARLRRELDAMTGLAQALTAARR